MTAVYHCLGASREMFLACGEYVGDVRLCAIPIAKTAEPLHLYHSAVFIPRTFSEALIFALHVHILVIYIIRIIVDRPQNSIEISKSRRCQVHGHQPA
jgi:hypothetical protein